MKKHGTIIESETVSAYDRCLLLAVDHGYASVYEWEHSLGLTYDEAATVLAQMKGEGMLEDSGMKTFARLKGYAEAEYE